MRKQHERSIIFFPVAAGHFLYFSKILSEAFEQSLCDYLTDMSRNSAILAFHQKVGRDKTAALAQLLASERLYFLICQMLEHVFHIKNVGWSCYFMEGKAGDSR